MIENQNLIFRPWAPANNKNGNLEITDTFMKDDDIQGLRATSCELKAICNRLTDLNKREYNLKTSNSFINKTSKSVTDAERLKRVLLKEKSNESKKPDKKSFFKKTNSGNTFTNDALKHDQQSVNKLNLQLSTNTTNSNSKPTNSPASSSAETRLINSRIAALSSASHLLNLETYSRLAAPINNQINPIAAAAANSTVNSLNQSLPYLLPNSNLPVLPNNNFSIDKFNLPDANNLALNSPNISSLNPNKIFPVHPLSPQSTMPSCNISSNLPNGLSQPRLPLNNHPLPSPQQLMSNSNLPHISNLPQLPLSISFDNKHLDQMVNPSHHTNLISPNQCLPSLPSTIPFLKADNSQFSMVNGNIASSTEVLMANLKKAQSIQLPKKNRPKKFFCNRCPANFANNGQLKGHFRTHTGERPFACDYEGCTKRFTRNEELTRHKKIHSGEKPFPCEICNKRFGRKDHLKKHIRTHERAAQPQNFAVPYLSPLYYFKI